MDNWAGMGFLAHHPAWRAVSRVLARPEARVLLSLGVVILCGIIFHADGAFYRWGTHRDTFRQISVFGILACGMTIVIISGGIDLSVGSVLGLVSVVFSIFSIHMGLPAIAAIPAALAVGTLCGMTSGALIARFHMQPFIVTLAMMVFARGLAKYVSGGMKISNYIREPDGSLTVVDMPGIYETIDARMLGNNVATVSLIMLACFFVAWLLLSRLRPGRYIYATGGNEAAARLSGAPVSWTKVLAYGMSGFFASVAGICQAAQEFQGDPEAGATYELTAIAIVVIGGTSLMGGRGGILLTLMGALTIGYLDKILSINAAGEATRLMLTGVIIVAAVLLQRGNR